MEPLEIALSGSADYFAVGQGVTLIASLEALCVGGRRTFLDFLGHAGIVHRS